MSEELNNKGQSEELNAAEIPETVEGGGLSVDDFVLPTEEEIAEWLKNHEDVLRELKNKAK